MSKGETCPTLKDKGNLITLKNVLGQAACTLLIVDPVDLIYWGEMLNMPRQRKKACCYFCYCNFFLIHKWGLLLVCVGFNAK